MYNFNIHNPKETTFWYIQYTCDFYKGKISRCAVSSIQEGIDHFLNLQRQYPKENYQCLGIVRVDITLTNELVEISI